jgi:hypothetical protein
MIKVSKGYLFFMGASFLFAIIAGGTLPFYIFYSLIFIYLTSYIYIFFQKYLIDAEVKVEDTVFKAGDTTECLTMIKCSTVIPVPYMLIKSLSYKASKEGYKGEVINLTRNEDSWIRSNIKFYHRGIYDLGTVDLQVQDLFHIFSLNKIVDSNVKVKVYPKIYDIVKMHVGGKDIYQNAIDIKSTNEDIFTIKDVRKYIEGDSLKRVHWKLSAKHGELFVKNSDNIAGEEFAIFLDMNKDNLKLDQNRAEEEGMVDLCVSLVRYMLMKGICTKVFVNCTLPRCIDVNTMEQFDSMMDFFLNQQSDGDEVIGEFLYKNFYKLQRNVRIGIITSKVDSAFCNSISKIKNYGYGITIFYPCDNEDTKSNINYLNNLGVECIKISSMQHSIRDR